MLLNAERKDAAQPHWIRAWPLSPVHCRPRSLATLMGHHTVRRLCLLIGCITFIVLVLNRSNHDRVWDTPTYFESMFEHAHLYPLKSPPHRKLQFGLLETVCIHRHGTPVPHRSLG